jgi:hypothetical protein
MRCYVIRRGSPALPPFVVAEAGDESWAKSEVIRMPGMIVLSATEAELDPDYSAAIAAWKDGDDSAVVEFDALLDLELQQTTGIIDPAPDLDPAAEAVQDEFCRSSLALANTYFRLQEDHGQEVARSFLRQEIAGAMQVLRPKNG